MTNSTHEQRTKNSSFIELVPQNTLKEVIKQHIPCMKCHPKPNEKGARLQVYVKLRHVTSIIQ
jgi:hypothetical protein